MPATGTSTSSSVICCSTGRVDLTALLARGAALVAVAATVAAAATAAAVLVVLEGLARPGAAGHPGPAGRPAWPSRFCVSRFWRVAVLRVAVLALAVLRVRFGLAVLRSRRSPRSWRSRCWAPSPRSWRSRWRSRARCARRARRSVRSGRSARSCRSARSRVLAVGALLAVAALLGALVAHRLLARGGALGTVLAGGGVGLAALPARLAGAGRAALAVLAGLDGGDEVALAHLGGAADAHARGQALELGQPHRGERPGAARARARCRRCLKSGGVCHEGSFPSLVDGLDTADHWEPTPGRQPSRLDAVPGRGGRLAAGNGTDPGIDCGRRVKSSTAAAAESPNGAPGVTRGRAP